jgi:oligopeptide transport system substrate-binding protein
MTFLELFTSTRLRQLHPLGQPDYDALIEAARAETDEAKALEDMIEAEHILIEESPIVPVSFPPVPS